MFVKPVLEAAQNIGWLPLEDRASELEKAGEQILRPHFSSVSQARIKTDITTSPIATIKTTNDPN